MAKIEDPAFAAVDRCRAGAERLPLIPRAAFTAAGAMSTLAMRDVDAGRRGAGKVTRMSRYPALIAAAALLLAMSPALGQRDQAADYPNRPVKIIVSVPAGGGVDIVTRIYSAGLQQRVVQSLVIENPGHADGTISTDAVSFADADS